MQGTNASSHIPVLDDWYVACASSELADRKPLASTIYDTPLVLFRDSAGTACALLDRCPHRNVPLSIGKMRDGQIMCVYHGWRFDGAGSCRAVPGLVGEADAASRCATAFPSVSNKVTSGSTCKATRRHVVSHIVFQNRRARLHNRSLCDHGRRHATRRRRKRARRTAHRFFTWWTVS